MGTALVGGWVYTVFAASWMALTGCTIQSEPMDGMAVADPPHDVDMVISTEAAAAEPNSFLEPGTLLEHGFVGRVVYHGRLYWMDGPQLASIPYSGETMRGAWSVRKGSERWAGLGQKIVRIVIDDSSGKQRGFIEVTRTHSRVGWTARRPIGIINALAGGTVALDDMPMRNFGPNSPRLNATLLLPKWQVLATARGAKWPPGYSEIACAPGAPVHLESHWPANNTLDIGPTRLHPRSSVLVACQDGYALVAMHEGVRPFSEDANVLLHRYDIERGAWHDAFRIALPNQGFLLAGMAVRGERVHVLFANWNGSGPRWTSADIGLPPAPQQVPRRGLTPEFTRELPPIKRISDP